jgi:uncharacterized protein
MSTILQRRRLALCLGLLLSHFGSAFASEPPARLLFEPMPAAKFEFQGPVGGRIKANVDNWLLRAPEANPGMLEMFRLRDRQPVPQLVPWAGEFVGKYLISAVQALRMSDDPRLRPQVADVVSEFISTQAEDGYLGPFPMKERLLKNWDLWGHYHAIYALLLWHDQTGDPAALAAARRAADLVCATYLDTGRRVFDAGDQEMNMTILTALAMLHRRTGQARYLRMAREVETDWERAGDYLRAGLDGREYYQSPRPRWESLHDLQGLIELWRITGDQKYHDSFTHHWRSIRRWDRRNTGGFSSGEQATGDPFAPTAIETCCTVAWMALTLDYLSLSGDIRAADDLELATLNGGLGAQHPSGRWWTYNTPMDGTREASAHTIVFQARAGTPELNCCSVNGPRVLGMLSEWALMSATNGVVLNWLGAGEFSSKLPDGTGLVITSSGDAWRDGKTELRVRTKAAAPFNLLLRIPAWAVEPSVALNGSLLPNVHPGSYLNLTRTWKPADRLLLSFQTPLRFVAGANEAAGKVSLYRGPLLLAFDQARNAFDEGHIPAVDLRALTNSRSVSLPTARTEREQLLQPWVLVEVPSVDGRPLTLVDFASAGAAGTHYRSWLTGEPSPATPVFTQIPPDGARLRPGDVRLRWKGPRRALNPSYRVELAANEAFKPLLWTTNCSMTGVMLNTQDLAPAESKGTFFWRVVALGPGGETLPDVPPARFVLDAGAPPQILPPEPLIGPDKELVIHSLRGDDPPRFGQLLSPLPAAAGSDGRELNGRDQLLRYALGAWPQDDWTVALRVRIREMPRNHLGQVFSAWHKNVDDPLRLVLDGGKLYARIEAGAGYSTPGVALEPGRWYALAAVRRAETMRLFVDGKAVGSCAVPAFLPTQATDCALGGNPHYNGNEFLAASFADFAFYARALSDVEIQRLASP